MNILKQPYLQYILLFAITSFLGAQESVFSGIVVDEETNLPLADVYVYESSQNLSDITKKDGTFKITSKSKALTLNFQHISYQLVTKQLKANQYTKVALVFAQTNLDDVVVTSKAANRSGVKTISKLSVDSNDIKRNSGAQLGDLLSQISGVTFISTGQNVQLPVIHGLYGNRILVLNNGFKHGFQNWGSDHAPELDISGAEQIKVVKGTTAVKYGPDALGGAVIVENNALSLDKPLFARLTSSYQTNGRGYGSNLSLGEGKENFSYYGGISYNHIGDRKAPNYFLTNTGMRDFAAQAGLRYDWNSWSFKTNYSIVNQNLGILRSAVGSSGAALIRNIEATQPTFIRPFSYEINEPNQEVQHQLASLKTTKTFENGNVLYINFARQWNARKEFDVRRNANLPVLDLALETNDLQIEYEHKIGQKISGSAGVQYFFQSNENNPGTGITPFIPNYKIGRYSAFLIEALELDKATWELGVRYDIEQNGVGGRDNRQVVFKDNFSFSNFSVSFGNLYKLSNNKTLRNNLGFGWRPPNMAELYSFGQHEAQTTFGLLRYKPNDQSVIEASEVTLFNESNVNPENSIKYTTEFEWRTNKDLLSINAYANYIENFIFSRPIGVLGTARGPMPTFVVDQANAFFWGTDITYTRNYLPKGKATIGGSYIWSRNVERNEPLINQPPILLNARIDQSFDKMGYFDELDFSIRPSYTFRQFQAPRVISIRSLVEGTADLDFSDPIFDFLPPPDGYFLLNASVGLSKNNFYFSLEARNILNTSFRDYLNNMRYFADEMGINMIFSVTYKI